MINGILFWVFLAGTLFGLYVVPIYFIVQNQKNAKRLERYTKAITNKAKEDNSEIGVLEAKNNELRDKVYDLSGDEDEQARLLTRIEELLEENDVLAASNDEMKAVLGS